MSGQARRAMVAGLAVASAFSSMPSAFYHLVESPWPLAWTTPVLFVVHGVAQIAAMGAVLRRRRSPDPVRTARTVVWLLLANAVGGLVLVAAPPTGAGAVVVLLAGRVLCGAALGAITALVSGVVAARPGGPAVVTAAVLGAVGCGSLLAGALTALGLSRSAALGVGVGGLAGAAVVLAASSRAIGLTRPDEAPAVARARAVDGGARGRPGAGIAAALTLAFASHGVLALFSSVLPGLVASLAHGAALVAGVTAGTVMLAAGAVRLLLRSSRARAVRLTGLLAAALGGALLAGGLAGASLPSALTGGLLLGAACGIAYETALGLATSVDRTGGALIRVQRAAQLGLVLPVALWPLASAGSALLAHLPAPVPSAAWAATAGGAGVAR